MKFRKKPVVIEAWQWTAAMHAGKESFHPCVVIVDDQPYIDTLEGHMKVSIGDWIIRGVKGEYYPCKPDIFEATYESVI